MGDKMRIYIGGLGSSVQEDDLKKTFTAPQLGNVESVEIIRSKGRSFGYIEFVPASDKGLSKLFSTYNGCMWKGGRLKLEKAKEHYLFRLRREWAEDAELEIKSSLKDVDANESFHAVQKPKKDQDIGKMQLKIFFPKLRKIKPVPLKGTGKHKYSFQRVEVPPLPIHFCDCEEHCGPPESVKRNCTNDHETDSYGVNEDELNMMKLVLNKFLEKENCSETVPNEAQVTEKTKNDVVAVYNWQVDHDEEDQVSDEDGLIINIVGQPSKKDALFQDWGQKTSGAKQVQDSFEREPVSFSGPIPEMHGNKKQKLLSDKKRKQSVHENYSKKSLPSKRNAKKKGNHDVIDDPVAVSTQPTGIESGSTRISRDVASSHKSAMTDVVSEKGSADFHISDILMDVDPEVEAKTRRDHGAAAPSFNEKNIHEDQSSKYQNLEKPSDVQSTKLIPTEDKSARGASWLQKSSWLQLVGDTSNSAFNLSEILPGVSFEKQELRQFTNNEFSNSRSRKQHSFARKDQNPPAEATSKPQGIANKDIYVTPGNSNAIILTKEQNHPALEGQEPNSESKNNFEKKDEASALVPAANVVRSNRAVGDIVVSETCPFMRSAASMKEWAKTKAALSGAHKKKGKGKELVQD
ncbi:hypothetical protein CDL12_27799 [Handroanthus impetiginosus]|uniref:RRM domain-containing protein n=1 Tax=Handroanthus impetiginosus TaxID=429701 RepID=A0A2G9G319_9LAMI|nr:hypothetical protein CDL12_27799 [Handroanthus impetiginosus]